MAETGELKEIYVKILTINMQDKFYGEIEMSKKIGIIGSGMVGQALAGGFLQFGYEVMIGSGDAAKRRELGQKLTGVKTGDFAETAKFGEIIVLAVKGSAAVDMVKELARELSGKTVLDTTNPIADLPPVNGVLQLFTEMNESLMERLQKAVPQAKFVKAFSCIGAAFMVKPDFAGLKPTMFICGNDTQAKEEAKVILRQFGWEVDDMGMAEAARAIEPIVMLWCLPGFRENKWSHGLKMLKSGE